MTNAERVLSIARKQVGVRENPARSNNVKYNTWYYGRTVYGEDYPWCMAFVQWCYNEALLKLPFLTASCTALYDWYAQNHPECIVKKPTPGCIILYHWPNSKRRFNHTGIFERFDGKNLVAIEGNTGIGGSNETNGGQVMRRVRDPKYAKAFIKPLELEDEMSIDDFIKELTPDQAYKIYIKATDYMARMSLPTSWNSKEQLDQAVKDGITDGTRPMCPTTRLESSIMCDRILKKLLEMLKK